METFKKTNKQTSNLNVFFSLVVNILTVVFKNAQEAKEVHFLFSAGAETPSRETATTLSASLSCR